MTDLFCGNSTMAVRPVLPEEGGSIPTLPLHRLLRVEECNPAHVNGIIKRLHYSHSIFGVTALRCYRVLRNDITVGAAIFGFPAGTGVYDKYAAGKQLLELRRFVLADDLPKNSESFCLGVMFRALRKLGVQRILSYADPSAGHRGGIYAATGFTLKGRTAQRTHYDWSGKRYPDRNLHQTNFPFHAELRAAVVSGAAKPVKIEGKYIWLKEL